MFVHKVLFAFLEFMHPRLLLVSPAIRLHAGSTPPGEHPYPITPTHPPTTSPDWLPNLIQSLFKKKKNSRLEIKLTIVPAGYNDSGTSFGKHFDHSFSQTCPSASDKSDLAFKAILR